MQETERLKEIKYLLKIGEIDYDSAKQKAEPLLLSLNERGKEVSRGFGKQWQPISFTKFMR